MPQYVYRHIFPTVFQGCDDGERRLIHLFSTIATIVIRSDDEGACKSINTDEGYEALLQRFKKKRRVG